MLENDNRVAMYTAKSWLMSDSPVFSFLLGSSGNTVVTNIEQKTEVRMWIPVWVLLLQRVTISKFVNTRGIKMSKDQNVE